MEDNEKELMAQLEGIMNNAGEDLMDKTVKEATHIFSELCNQFDRDIPDDVEAILMGMVQVTDPDEEKEARQRARDADRAIMSQYLENGVDDPESRAMRLQSIVTSLDAESILDLLQDTETAMLLSAWLEPEGLITRVRRPDGLLQVMTTAGSVQFIKTLPTGDRIVRFWGHERKENGRAKYPERDDFANEYEYELCRGTYKYLAMPLELKKDSEAAYDTMLNAISEKLQRQVRKDNDDTDQE
jgi:hypothetical protein